MSTCARRLPGKAYMKGRAGLECKSGRDGTGASSELDNIFNNVDFWRCAASVTDTVSWDPSILYQ